MQMREGEAPSYFNPIEATALVDLVEGLINQHKQAVGRPAVSPNDIGVIATYRKQVATSYTTSPSLRTVKWGVQK